MASRPDYHKDNPVSLRLAHDLLRWVADRAAETGQSRSALIAEAVREKRDRTAAGAAH
jgi:hypothetical protein